MRLTAIAGEVSSMAKKKHKQHHLEAPVSSSVGSRGGRRRSVGEAEAQGL
jgi:hypothetical protein